MNVSSLFLVFALSLCLSTPCLGVEAQPKMDPIIVNEALLPVNAVKANSEVQLRRVQRMMAENRDQTFGLLNSLKSLAKSNQEN